MESTTKTRIALSSFNLKKKKFHVEGSLVCCDLPDAVSPGSRRIMIDQHEVIPEIGYSIRPFYGCSLGWGAGAEERCFNTALSMCCAIFRDERIAQNLYIPFKYTFVDAFPEGNFQLDLDLTLFLEKNLYRIKPNLHSFFCQSVWKSREILAFKNPATGVITADLAYNYALSDQNIADFKICRLKAKKQLLPFRLFAKQDYLISGYTLAEVIDKTTAAMDKFYQHTIRQYCS